MTVQELIDRALHGLRVIALGDEATGTEADYCLDQYNDMMFAFERDGLDFAHAAQVLGDTIDLPDGHLEAIRLSLMERIAPTFGKEMAPRDIMAAEQGRMALRAYHFNMGALRSDHPLARNQTGLD
jgi:hypothetical protein